MNWFFADDAGKLSAMRLVVIGSAVVGNGLCVAGAVALFMRIPDALQLVVIGAGIVGGALTAKAVQKGTEAKLKEGS